MNRLLLASLALGLAACGSPTPEPNPAGPPSVSASAADPAAVRADIEALTARYQAAARAGDAAAIAALYADDAVIHPPNAPAVRGRAAIDAAMANEYKAPVDLTLTTVDVAASDAGDLAYEVGTNAQPQGPGKYLTVYRRTADGWRIVADTWSHDAPPAAPAN